MTETQVTVYTLVCSLCRDYLGWTTVPATIPDYAPVCYRCRQAALQAEQEEKEPEL
jgi:hypothetical protein